jgi:hypothetical protein
MSRASARAATVILLLAAAGCGGSAGSPSDGGGGGAGSSGGTSSTLGATGCTSIQGSCLSNAGTSTPSCEEHGGFDSASDGRFKSNCQHPNQTYSTSPCDRTGAVGGCARAISGTCDIAWAYGTLVTASDIQTSCMGANGTFITPP